MKEEPLSADSSVFKKLPKVDFRKMPRVDVEELRVEDALNERIDNIPFRFGKDMFVNLNPENSGTWTQLDKGKIWRLGIASEGALSLNLTFDNFHLPKGARLFIYNADRTQVLGAYSSLNNQEDRFFATSLIAGDSLILEYFEPDRVPFRGEINLWRVTHGYKSIGLNSQSFGDAASCQVNVVCPAGDNLRNEARSVVMLITGGSVCTGTLINNTLQDGRPFILTADHCYDTPGSVVVWFNWQSSTCSNPNSSPTYKTISGAVQRARYPGSDMWLLELLQTPPANYNVYYSGWNRTNAPSIYGRFSTIHHPSADIKKISWSDGRVVKTSYFEDTTSNSNSHWRLTSWTGGSTEGGSSGAPLFDAQNLVIGQLHGGKSECGNIYPDYFGRLTYSWEGGGSPANSLKTWLDPLGTGFTVFPGYDPNFVYYNQDAELSRIVSPQAEYTSPDTIVPTIEVSNNGLETIPEIEIAYQFDNGPIRTQLYSENLFSSNQVLINLPKIALTEGQHHFWAKISTPNDENSLNDSIFRTIQVVECQLLSFPLNINFDSTLLSPCWNERVVSGSGPVLSLVSVGEFPEVSPFQGERMLEFNSADADSSNAIRLETPAFDTPGFDSISVSFEWFYDDSLAKANDALVIQYSQDLSTWVSVDTIYRFGTDTLGWVREKVLMPTELNNTAGNYIGMLFISGNGRNCLMDSLVITGTPIEEPYVDFSVSNRTPWLNDTVLFEDASLNGSYSTWQWNFGSGAVPGSATGIGPHKVVYETTGLKSARLLVNGSEERNRENYLYVEELLYTPPYNLMANAVKNEVDLTWALFSDGFESGDLSRWDSVIIGNGTHEGEGNSHWWVNSGLLYSFEGRYFAAVDWGFNIDTWLISPEIPVDNLTILSFNWKGSYTYNVAQDRGDLTVQVSTDGGSSWEEVWSFKVIGEWNDFQWYATEIDLSGYNGEVVKIAFRMVGDDNGDVYLDNVYFGKDDDGVSSTQTTLAKKEHNQSITLKTSTGSFNRQTFDKKLILKYYTIFRNDTMVGTANDNFYIDTGLKPGTYRYHVVANYADPTGVSKPSNEVIVKISPDGLYSIRSAETIWVYPNPSTGFINSTIEKECLLTVISMKGEVLMQKRILPYQQEIDLHELQDGIYILQFSSDNELRYARVVIEH